MLPTTRAGFPQIIESSGNSPLTIDPPPDDAVISNGSSRENHGVGANEAITPNGDRLDEFTVTVSACK